MFSREDVSHDDRSSDMRRSHPENMYEMSLHFDMSSFATSEETSFRHSLNQLAVDFGAIPSSVTATLPRSLPCSAVHFGVKPSVSIPV